MRALSMRRFGLVCAFPLCLAAPAAADPTIGIGLSFAFGNGSVDTGIGLRVFSDNRRNRAVASIGVDYMFNNQSWRGTVGAAYLTRNAYIGADLGFDFGTGNITVGPSIGLTRATRGGGGGGDETPAPEPEVPEIPDDDVLNGVSPEEA